MHEKDPQASDLTNFVINSVPLYEGLSANTLEEGKEKFSAAAVAALETSRTGEHLGAGAFHEVYALQDNDKIAIKVLKTEGYDDTKLANVWRRIQDEHQTVAAYLGGTFVPDTEFAVIKTGLGPDAQSSRREYVVVQERLSGQKLEYLRGQIQASPELKAGAVEYVMRYEKMMRDGIVMDHPDDLMINDTPGAIRMIAVLDTNNLAKFTDIANNRNIKVFLQEYGIDPTTIKIPEDIVRIVRGIVPSILGLHAQETAALQEQDYPTLMRGLREGGELLPGLRDSLRRIPSDLQNIPLKLRDNPYLDQLLSSGFEGLAHYADRFAPQGQHPKTIAAIMHKLSISDADLRVPTPLYSH